MDRVVNNEMQPLILEGGEVLPAAGTPEAGPKEVTLSELDQRRYVETGRLSIVKLAATAQTNSAPAPPSQPKSVIKEKS
jgi:hypothetical protein